MKKFILAFATLISTVSFSQVITVNYKKTKAFKYLGNTAQTPEFTTSLGIQVFDIDGNCKKEIDLDKMESRFYENGILKNTLKIISYTKSKNCYEIILDDFNMYSGKAFNTYQIIDITKQKSYYSWYYDGDSDITWVCDEYFGDIKIK